MRESLKPFPIQIPYSPFLWIRDPRTPTYHCVLHVNTSPIYLPDLHLLLHFYAFVKFQHGYCRDKGHWMVYDTQSSTIQTSSMMWATMLWRMT